MVDKNYKCMNCDADLSGLYEKCPGCLSDNIRVVNDKTGVYEMNKLCVDATHHYINLINKKATGKYDKIDEIVIDIDGVEKVFTLKEFKSLLKF